MPRFKVSCGHDWAVVECSSPSIAERSVRAFFGIRGSDHELKTEETGDPVGHSGQPLRDEAVVLVPIIEEPVKVLAAAE